MKKVFQSYNIHFKNKAFIYSTVISFLFLVVSLFVNYYAGTYATERASSPVTDIILSNIRAFDVDGFFVYGGLSMVLIILIVCLLYPRKLPFTLKTIALFVIIRSVFISVTHIAPFPLETDMVSQGLFAHFSFGGDLFFSGHTGLPFLMALLFWDVRRIRFLFLGMSFFFGVVVLLGHLHYTIDVLAAFFITYAIYDMSVFFFKKDHQYFLMDSQE